ncbi:MAG: hypothetical protein JOY68_01040 [Candidatus Dormibacteraeota bacterium]|nr:hypothetical protein [Candidatus Dormibacteraeota bacterium]MBV8444359.1 hypothetical protein [Candidatus Dormibacteraeota bacterium]
MSAAALSEADLRFVNLVASRRFHGVDPAPPGDVAAVLIAAERATAFERAAALARELLQRGVFATAAAETALLAMLCRLAADGYDLVAPQGAVVGMVRGLAEGSVDERTVARWLQDRAVPRAA